MAETILFVDPGSIITGYAWREGSQIVSSTIAIKAKTLVPSRLKLIRSELAGIIQNPDNPEFKRLVIEIPVAHDYARNVGRKGKQVTIKALFILSRAIGVIQECCATHGLDVVDIEATKWTKGFPKQYRCSGASQMVDRTISDENEADAICLMDWWERIGQYG